MIRYDLICWMERNRPDLSQACEAAANHDDRREILNAVTGLDVMSCDSIESGSARFLEALIRISEQPPPGSTDNHPTQARH